MTFASNSRILNPLTTHLPFWKEDGMGPVMKCLAVGCALILIVGCYYYEEDYLRAGSRKGTNFGANPDDSNPYSPAPAPPVPRDDTQPEYADGPDDAPPLQLDDAVRQENRLNEAGLLQGGYNLGLRLIGVLPEAKPALEREIRALRGVDSVLAISYSGGELKLGLRHDGSVRELQAGIHEACARHGVRRFRIELLGSIEPRQELKVRIFAPGEGVRLASTTVFVGVEVEGAENAEVTVNGVPAEPFGAPGKFKARIVCDPGENVILALARDENGRTARATRSINVYDGEPAPRDDALTVLIQGKVDDPLSTVTVDGRPVKVNPDGSYRVEVVLNKGQEAVVVVVLDSLGNKDVRKIPVSGR